MYSVSETIEAGNIYVTSHPGIWIQEEILKWPPSGSGIDRKNIVTPGPDWIPYKCRILRTNIGKSIIYSSKPSSIASELRT